jgi:hypothetical protein
MNSLWGTEPGREGDARGSTGGEKICSAVVARIYVFCALFLRRQSEGVQKGLFPPFGRRAAPPRRVMIILLKSGEKIKTGKKFGDFNCSGVDKLPIIR